MLTEIYIEALLVDEELADQVWELWGAGITTDAEAARAWCMLANGLIKRNSDSAEPH